MTIDRNQIIEDMKQMLIEELFIDIPVEELTEEDSFTEIGLDSVGGLELVILVEDKFKIKIEEEGDLAENSGSIGIFADYILSKINQQQS
ncbi:MAG: acyl carrier protein [Candidatus Poribacteria bacterium]|nr:acyl carrier protein [Candidatus Poribacteria bacterium]